MLNQQKHYKRGCKVVEVTTKMLTRCVEDPFFNMTDIHHICECCGKFAEPTVAFMQNKYEARFFFCNLECFQAWWKSEYTTPRTSGSFQLIHNPRKPFPKPESKSDMRNRFMAAFGGKIEIIGGDDKTREAVLDKIIEKVLE